MIAGSAVQLICQTGRHTTLGQLAATLIAKPPPTSFEIGLRRFSILILRITVVLVLLVMAESMAFHRPWMDAMIFALALAVGLTPELLPMIMTVTLARGAVRLSHQRVIVKSLPAIHNLGAMDVLCTDKTGTLTEARIALTRHVDITDHDSERVLTLAWLNSHFESGLKSPLDNAILAYGTIDPSPWRKIDEVPFDFERRCVSVLVERDSVRTLILKGAPEDVMRICISVEMPDGTSRVLTDELRAKVQALFDRLSAQGFRLLGIATNVVGLDVYNEDRQNIGTIKDIALDASGLNGYIVSVGGFLGRGDHFVVVRPSAISLKAKDNKWHAAMNVNADQLKAAPEYKYSKKS